jgi:integrase/recombinase XerD
LTIEAAGAAFLDHERLAGRSPATLRARENALRQFGKVWGGQDLREVEPADLEAYAKDLLSRVSKETAYLYLATVRALFRHLADTQAILIDPSRRLIMPRMRSRPLGNVFSQAEMARLLESQEGLRERALLELLYSTGLRVSEARKLKVEELGADVLFVRGGKGGKDRAVPVGKRAMGWIRRYLTEARPKTEAAELFVNQGARGFGDAHFRQFVRGLGKKAGLAGLTCHAIRRSMATHLLSAGANPKEVSAILGHEDLRSLARYIRTAARDVRETHRKTHPREEGA